MIKDKYSRQRYEERKASNLCVRCGKPLDREGAVCTACKNRQTAYGRELYKKLQAVVVCRDFAEEKYVIAWKQDEACFEYQQYGCSIMNFEQLSGCEIEVVGNIFDSPELLESEE